MTEAQDPTAQFFALQEALAGRYSLERELGRGGMGIVYLAQDVALDRPVALKLLPPDYAAQPSLKERFVREARTAARLSHPNIVPIHAVDEVGGFVFFVMSFVEGQTLGERIRERGPVPPREAGRILQEVAWALGYAHAQGVVHRDIKPDNILLEAGSGRALVTDFGIAHVGRGAGLTTAGELLGTPEYMSPEQAGGGEVDGRSDLYALGVVGRYMLTGELPFQGANVHATLAKQLTEIPPAMGAVAPEVPGALAEALDRCLEKDPEDRIEGGEELAAALGRVLRDRKEIPAAIRLFQEQNRESNSVIAAVLMLLVATVGILAALVTEGGASAVDLFSLILITAGTGGWLLLPLGMLGVTARRVLKAGYGYDEVVLALRADVNERRRELTAEVGSADGAVDVWAPRVLLAGGAVMTASIFSVALPAVPESVILWGIFGGGLSATAAGIVSAARHSLRKAVPGERWLKFWDSMVGRGVFKIAGLGVERGAGATGGAYRPTEMAIGMAAERIFRELPEDVRKSLGDLPAVVESLERHARGMRARVKELDRALTEAEDLGGFVGEDGRERAPAAAGKRGAVVADLQRARDAAEGRLREVVAALERMRLELLRLHAGSGTVESLTADLSAARALSDDVTRLLEGKREVEELLGEVVDAGEDEDTPVPEDEATPVPV